MVHATCSAVVRLRIHAAGSTAAGCSATSAPAQTPASALRGHAPAPSRIASIAVAPADAPTSSTLPRCSACSEPATRYSDRRLSVTIGR